MYFSFKELNHRDAFLNFVLFFEFVVTPKINTIEITIHFNATLNVFTTLTNRAHVKTSFRRKLNTGSLSEILQKAFPKFFIFIHIRALYQM